MGGVNCNEIWFRVGGIYDLEITPVTVVRKSEQNVWVESDRSGRTRRCAIRSTWDNYFATYDEAAAYVKNRLDDRLLAAERDARHAQKKIGAFAKWRAENDEKMRALEGSGND